MNTQIQDDSDYYTGPERRHARQPRRGDKDRRYRRRKESLISDFRSGEPRRQEDAEGFMEIKSLYPDTDN